MNDAKDTWFTKEEYKKILLDQCLTVNIMRSLRILAKKEGVAFDDNYECGGNHRNGKSSCEQLMKKLAIDLKEYCERGLESYQTEEGRNKINLDRKRHKLSVIREHNRQGMAGTKDPELVRRVSMAQSKISSCKAQLLAAIDQQEERASNSNSNSNISAKDGNGEKEEQAPGQQPRPLGSFGSPIDANCKKYTDPSPSYNQGMKRILSRPVHRNDTHFVPDAPRDDFFEQHQQQQYRDFLLKKQQEQYLLDLLLKQQRQHAQCHLHYHPQKNNKNGFMNIQQNTPSTAIEASIMLTSIQEQQQQHQQLCYQKSLQQLLHHQRQQKFRVIGMATAALVDHSLDKDNNRRRENQSFR